MTKSKILKNEEITLIENKIKNFELETGCELLLVIRKESGEYKESSWKLAVFLAFIFMYLFISLLKHFNIAYEHNTPLIWPILIFMLTVLLYLLSRIDCIKSKIISEKKADTNCHEKALISFYTQGVSKVSHKVTTLLMLSLLEKKIIILIDSKLKEKIEQHELDELIQIMKISFRKNKFCEGLSQSIEKLQNKILKDFNGKVSTNFSNELSDRIHFL